MLKEDFKQGREYFDNVLAEAEKTAPYDMRTISCLTPISCYALMRVTLKNEDNMLPVT